MRTLGSKTSANGSTVGWSCVVAVLALATGCSTLPDPIDGSPDAHAGAASGEPASAVSGRFAVAASMLDTWNAVGQILVALEGVHYEGRAQMLGIYAVTYRGERFLILTRARVIQTPGDGMMTEVDAVGHDGQPIVSNVAVELLARLQQRLPAELVRIAALPPAKQTKPIERRGPASPRAKKQKGTKKQPK